MRLDFSVDAEEQQVIYFIILGCSRKNTDVFDLWNTNLSNVLCEN